MLLYSTFIDQRERGEIKMALTDSATKTVTIRYRYIARLIISNSNEVSSK